MTFFFSKERQEVPLRRLPGVKKNRGPFHKKYSKTLDPLQTGEWWGDLF